MRNLLILLAIIHSAHIIAQNVLFPIQCNSKEMKVAIYEENHFAGFKSPDNVIKKRDKTENPIKIPSWYMNQLYDLQNHIIDSLDIINWNSDTLYIITNYDFINGYIFLALKSEKRSIATHIYPIIKSKYNPPAYKAEILDLKEYIKSSDNEENVQSDNTFFNTIFSWDMSTISEMLKYSDGIYDDTIDVYRIIISNRNYISVENLRFRDCFRWMRNQITKQIYSPK